jgi:hypothetical protein
MQSTVSRKLSIVLLTFLSVGILFSACKKSSTTPSSAYYMQANANGSTVKYTGYTAAISTSLSGNYVLDIQGQASLTSQLDILSAVIMDISPITTKTYTDVIVNGSPQGVVDYYNHIGNQYSSAFAVVPAVTITITEITSTYVAGTFSGTVSDLISACSLKLTNGSFKVQKR